MGIALPQLAPASEDRVSGAQVIDGSLKFDKTKQTYLTRTPGSAGNRKVWTLSYWIKFYGDIGGHLFSANNDGFQFEYRSGGQLLFANSGSTSGNTLSSARFRDYGQFYHVVIQHDALNSIARFYINGEENFTATLSDADGTWNNATSHNINGRSTSIDSFGSFGMSQVYFVDGQALGPRFFGFTDPLTGTWRPKKLNTGDISLNDGTVWSSGIPGNTLSGYPATNAFDGNTSTFVYADNTSTMTWTAPKGISGKKIEIYAYAGNTHPILKVNGKSTGAVVGGLAQQNVWVDVSHLCPGGTLDNIQAFGQLISSVNRSSGWSAVRVDGEILIDRKVVKSKNPNNGTTWSNSLTTNAGDNFDGSGAKTKAFDNSDNKAYTANNSDGTTQGTSYLEMVFPSAISGALRVKCDNGNTVRNTTGGGDVLLATQSTGSDNQFVDCGTVSGLTNLRVLMSGGSRPAISFIELDGQVFIDGATDNSFYLPMDGSAPIGEDQSGNGNDFTSKNFGGSNSVEKATGALPILKGAGGAVAVGVRTDAYANNLVLAVPLVGIATDVSHIINSGSTKNSITNSGVDFARTKSNFYGGSADFTGASTDVLYTASDNTKYQMGTGNFTAECWVYSTSTSGTQNIFQIFAGGTKYFGVYYSSSSLRFQIAGTGGAEANAGDIVFGNNQWHHVALVRDGSTLRGFVDGEQVTSAGSITSNLDTDGYIAYIGRHQPSNNGFTGYMQDFRIYKGVAKYTSDFVPASTSPDILPDTPSGVSGGSKLTKITDGAVSFNGTATTKLRVSDSTDFSFGTNDFCIEYFYYNNSLDGTYNIIFDNIDTNRSGIQLSMFTSNHYSIEVGDGASNWIWKTTGDYPATQHQWVHFALTRQGSTFRAFENGVLLATATSSTAVGNPRAAAIGGYSADDTTVYGFDGYISNFRIVNGSSVYTSNFTPPTAPLTNITNTKLLCCQSNTSAGAAVVSPSISGSINTGIVWSEGTLLGSIESARPWPLGFNGDLSTFTRPTNSQMATIVFDTPISFSSKFEIKGSLDSSTTGSIEVLDGTGRYINVSSSFGSPTVDPADYPKVDLTSSLTSPVRGIRFNGISGATAQPRFTGIYVDDTLLVDPVTRLADSAATNFNPFNTNINTVRGQETGYPTLNPLYPNPNGNSPSDGNLKQTTTAGNGQYNATMAIPQTGSWYWEVTKEGTDSTGIIGISNPKLSVPSHNANNVGAFSWYIAGPRKQTASVDADYGSGVSQGDVVGVAYNADIRELRFYLNGEDQGVAFDASSIGVAEYFPAFSAGSSVNTFTFSVNFGQKPFKFPPPDGYQSLNLAAVLPEKVINPKQYVGVATYSGNSGDGLSTTQDIDVGLNPDLIWIKDRDATNSNLWTDTVRGIENQLLSNDTAGTNANASRIPALVHNGFRVGGRNEVNDVGVGYVVWSWRAGGSKNTFNVDDVGYASASDVGMSAGAQNTNAYNQSETWSTLSAANAKGFDGSMAYDSGANRMTGASTYHKVLNAATTFTNVTSVRIGVSENVGDVKLDGIVYTTSYISGVGLIVTNPPTKLREIEILGRAAPGGVQLSYIMINGVLLVDNGVSVTNVPSIPSDKCSVGTKNGFSIVQYEGNGTTNQTLAHGLSQAPDFVIIKNMSAAYGWAIWHKDLSLNGGSAHNSPEYDMIDFSTSGETDFSEDCIWDVFDHSLKIHRSGSGNWLNTDGSDYVMYSWHDVPGLQKFGKYTGNGDSDGIYVELGFKPLVIIIKRIDSDGDHWFIHDGVRNTFNPTNKRLYPSWNQYEFSNVDALDILSKGFKIRTNDTSWNAGSGTYIYAAWAEAPSSNLYGATSNAR